MTIEPITDEQLLELIVLTRKGFDEIIVLINGLADRIQVLEDAASTVSLDSIHYVGDDDHAKADDLEDEDYPYLGGDHPDLPDLAEPAHFDVI